MTTGPVPPANPGPGINSGPGVHPAQAMVPPPPAGPGVQAPFVSPPTDGARQRRGWAVGLTIATVLLCCVGGLAGSGGLLVLGSRMIIDSTKAVVTRYLDAVRTGDYPEAYQQLCDAEQGRRSEAEFTEDVRDQPKIASFQVGEPIIDNSDEIRVPTSVQYTNGNGEAFEYYVVQDQSTGQFEVCGRSG